MVPNRVRFVDFILGYKPEVMRRFALIADTRTHVVNKLTESLARHYVVKIIIASKFVYNKLLF